MAELRRPRGKRSRSMERTLKQGRLGYRVWATIPVPQEYVGPVLTLCTEKRGTQKNMLYLGRQAMLTYELPLAEVAMNLFDRLKSVSRGYASTGAVPCTGCRRCSRCRRVSSR